MKTYSGPRMLQAKRKGCIFVEGPVCQALGWVLETQRWTRPTTPLAEAVWGKSSLPILAHCLLSPG